MADLLVVVLVIGFFGLCVALVYGCDHLIGPDDEGDLVETGTDAVPERARVTV